MTARLNFITSIAVLIVCTLSACQQAPDPSIEDDTNKVKAILKVIDHYGRNIDSTMLVYSDDVVHMPQGSRATTGKANVRKILEAESSYGKTVMKHELVTLHTYPDMVLTRGRATGSWTPPGGAAIPFETNNIITFRRMKDGSLKIWNVIFNRVTLENYPSASK
jgi:ketosteroid isomerase-like protein